MRIEDELRGALDVPAPPAATTLEDVLRRGKRKVAVRRAGVAGSVLVVVAVVAAGVLGLPFRSAGPADPVNWARATQAPGQQPDPPRDSRACSENPNPPPVLSRGGESLDRKQTDAWLDLTQSLLPNEKLTSTPIGYDLVRVFTVDVGTSSAVRFSRVRFDGLSPSAAADRALWASGGCTPPRRTTNAEGTVFQLYDAAPTGQALYVFRADGRSLQLEQVSVASEAGSLPLSEADFVKLGAAVAEGL
ncbi:hypothetical protein [Lentzea sp. NBRC 102530]|uniref:hypothetical protein n=1 Tax=Lentzea sp. NBRC 102530 TaxID=3032201 RepID=UPI0024A0C059|nr:hypothetical protein [Lentzea sp. NBRC 102530]GLY48140.1 hypothetical protein Lesp01_17960 [Lentzea sp. NBRC 102530]